MLAYSLRRFFTLILIVIAAVTLLFTTQRLAPGGPFDEERPPPPQVRENIRAYYDMDLPVYQQYWTYLFGMAGREIRDDGSFGQVYWFSLPEDAIVREIDGLGIEPGTFVVRQWCPWGEWTRRVPNAGYKFGEANAKGNTRLRKCGVFRLDFGTSLTRRSLYVNDIIATGLPASFRYAIPAILFCFLLGVPMGIIAAIRQNSATDYALVGAGIMGLIIPNVVMAPLLAWLLAIEFDGFLQWLLVETLGWYDGRINAIPSGKSGGWNHYILPTLVLGTALLGRIVRLSRAASLEVLRSNYIRTARAKGLPSRVILFRHVLKPALMPVVTFLGPVAAVILTGSVIVESQYALPGLGSSFIEAALARDYTLMLGVTVILLIFVAGLNFIVDLLYAWLDPRVRY